MNWKLFTIILILVLAACESVPDSDYDFKTDDNDIYDIPEKKADKEPTISCGDGTCQDSENKCTCPVDCGQCSGNISSTTQWACLEDRCKIVSIPSICGNNICEPGELGSCDDCPSCTDQDLCTKDSYNFNDQSCEYEKVVPCCGDGICESGETSNCLQDCSASVSLADYPEPFIVDDTFQAHLIVGSEGDFQPELIIASISLMNGLDYDEVKNTYTTTAKLDSEIASIKERNVILVGSPCQNQFVKELMPYHNNCDEAIPVSGGLIRLFKTGSNTYAIAVMGRTGQDIRRVGKYLENRRTMSGFEQRV